MPIDYKQSVRSGFFERLTTAGGEGHPIHDESIIPKVYTQKTEYRRGSTVINHFHEKLLLLPARMHTDYARKLAFERKDFMEQFLEQFHLEWNV